MNAITLRTVASLLCLALIDGAAAAQKPIELTLGGAARLAASRNAGAQSARHQADAAAARARQQHADLLPQIASVASEGERTFNSAAFGLNLRDPASGGDVFPSSGSVLGPVRSWDVRLSARQVVLDPALIERIRATRAAGDAERALAAAVAEEAAAAGAFAYVRVLRADALLTGRRSDSALAADLLAIALERLEAGFGTTLDVSRAQAQLASMASGVIAARGERDRAQLELRRALGLPLDATIEFTDTLDTRVDTEKAPGDETAMIARALHTRGDVAAAAARKESADRATASINAERLPSVTAFADRGGNGNGTTRLLNTYSWGVEVSLPLFDGLRREARVAEQRATAQALAVRERDLSEQVAVDVRGAMLALATARQEVVASGDRLSFAVQALGAARTRFAEGLAGNADVIAAQLELTSARTEWTEARAALVQARVAVARAQGTTVELQ